MVKFELKEFQIAATNYPLSRWAASLKEGAPIKIQDGKRNWRTIVPVTSPSDSSAVMFRLEDPAADETNRT